MIYTIPKGEHYSQPRKYGIHFGRTKETFYVRFDNSCLYPVADDYHQWNKGAGWTYGLFNDANSIRWCWRPKPGKMEVLEAGIYIHKNGYIFEPTQTIELPDLEETFTLELTNDTEGRIIYLDVHGEHISQTVSEHMPLTPACGWINGPYFGGQRPSPWDVVIDLTRKRL